MLNLNAQQSSNIANVQTLKRRATKATIALDKVVISKLTKIKKE
jgi:hypothetical protein